MDFVTVCFIEDIPQMKLQARSMAQYLKEFPVERIYIVVNGWYKKCLPMLQTILPEYDWLQDRVEIISATDIINPIPIADSYYNQMLMKILISKRLTSKTFCILDAKNFLCRSWTDELIFQNGKLRTSIQENLTSHWFEHWANCFEYYNLDYTKYPKVTQLTPFFAWTDETKEVAEHAVELFKHKSVAEFPLMQAALIKKYSTIDNHYWCGDKMSSGVWLDDINKINDRNLLKNHMFHNSATCLAMSIHRKSFARLNDCNLEQVKQVWQELELATIEEGQQLITDMKNLNPVRC